MEVIYRFMSLEEFMDIVLSKSLTFKHPSLWDDPYEVHIFDLLKDHFKEVHYKVAIQSNYHNTFAQSWTSLEESDALWRIYSHNKTSVRISVKTENIKKIGKIRISEVSYVDSLVSEKPSGDIYEMLSKKRREFEHEKEIRLFVDTQFEVFKKFTEEAINKGIDTRDYSILFEKLNNFLDDKNPKKIIQKIEFSKIENFIDSVVLNPLAKEHVNETIGLFCKANNINYLGKSSLYDVK